MSRRLAPLTLDTLGDLPERCRSCVFWELDPVAAERAVAAGDPAFDKEAWLSSALLEWGSCGRVAYVDDVPAGYVVYAPPAFVPRSLAFPTSPASADAVLLMTGHVVPQFRGGGLGRMLVQGAAKDLTRRGVRAIEAFGLAQKSGAVRRAGEGHPTPPGCIVPADFLLSVGFKTVRPHHRYPRLRLDLKTALSWREDVEMALERILGSVRAPVLTPR
ncbi:MAG TPA: GNAT family N-acetyltransferase [Actinomycetales bacterium]|nr:GNAT family N-acetyltransferase [Actinomycetales bacterium]